MSLTKQYLELDDAELQTASSIRFLETELKKIRIEKEKVKDAILQEYLEDGVVPDNGLIVSKVPAKIIVTDESLIPDRFFKVKKELDKKSLNDAVKSGEDIQGCTLSNGGYTVKIQAIKE